MQLSAREERRWGWVGPVGRRTGAGLGRTAGGDLAAPRPPIVDPTWTHCPAPPASQVATAIVLGLGFGGGRDTLSSGSAAGALVAVLLFIAVRRDARARPLCCGMRAEAGSPRGTCPAAESMQQRALRARAAGLRLELGAADVGGWRGDSGERRRGGAPGGQGGRSAGDAIEGSPEAMHVCLPSQPCQTLDTRMAGMVRGGWGPEVCGQSQTAGAVAWGAAPLLAALEQRAGARKLRQHVHVRAHVHAPYWQAAVVFVNFLVSFVVGERDGWTPGGGP